MAQRMGRTRPVQWFAALLVVFAAMAADVVFGAEPLFPQPLHLTRVIEDPISKTTISVDEYCSGNRVVTVRGEQVLIADYDRQELTEIDWSTSTYSITRFDEIARSSSGGSERGRIGTQAVGSQLSPRALGVRRGESGRTLEAFEIVGDDTRVEVAVDRSVSLTRGGFDALTGAAYPSQPQPHHEVFARAAKKTVRREVASNSIETSEFSLAAEQITQWEFEGADRHSSLGRDPHR